MSAREKKRNGVLVCILGSQVLTSGLSQQLGGYFFIEKSIYGLLLQCKEGTHLASMSSAHRARSHDVHDSLILLLLRHKRAASRLQYSGDVESYNLIITVI